MITSISKFLIPLSKHLHVDASEKLCKPFLRKKYWHISTEVSGTKGVAGKLMSSVLDSVISELSGDLCRVSM